MRADFRYGVLMAAGVATTLLGQGVAHGHSEDRPLIRARALGAVAPVKMFIANGTVHLIGWDQDSIVIRGHLPDAAELHLTGTDTGGMKLIVEARHGESPVVADLVIYLPRRSQASLKSVDASITVKDVSGWFYTVSGSIRVSGSASSVEAVAMTGNIDLEVTAPWVKAQTGQGHVLIRGAPQDVDASTIGGAVDIAAGSILRGRFSSVTGDIRYAGAPAPRSLFEFSNHAGSVDFLLARDVSATFDLSSVTGDLANGFVQVRPVALGSHGMRLHLGTGEAQVTVRTFKGTIRVRPQ